MISFTTSIRFWLVFVHEDWQKCGSPFSLGRTSGRSSGMLAGMDPMVAALAAGDAASTPDMMAAASRASLAAAAAARQGFTARSPRCSWATVWAGWVAGQAAGVAAASEKRCCRGLLGGRGMDTIGQAAAPRSEAYLLHHAHESARTVDI